jgi:hypothetical protein
MKEHEDMEIVGVFRPKKITRRVDRSYDDVRFVVAPEIGYDSNEDRFLGIDDIYELSQFADNVVLGVEGIPVYDSRQIVQDIDPEHVLLTYHETVPVEELDEIGGHHASLHIGNGHGFEIHGKKAKVLGKMFKKDTTPRYERKIELFIARNIEEAENLAMHEDIRHGYIPEPAYHKAS